MTNKKYGMSMVEVMIGAILLALMIIPSLNVILSQTQTVTATRDHSQAAYVAQKIQEMCRGYKFSFIDKDNCAGDPKETFEWKLCNLDEFKKHTLNGITYEITNVKIDPSINKETPAMPPFLYLLQFQIKYKGKDRREHLLEISTAISRRE